MKKAQLEMHFLGTKTTLTLALTLVSLVALMLTACNQTPNSEGMYRLYILAAAAGQTETVRALIESGANIEAKDEEDLPYIGNMKKPYAFTVGSNCRT